MTSRKLKNGQSYERIQKLMMETSDGQRLVEKALRRLNNVNLGESEFKTNYNDRPHCYKTVIFGVDRETTEARVSIDFTGSFYFTMSPKHLITDDDIKELVEANFGVTKPGSKKPSVPTFFCKAPRVIQYLENARNLDNLLDSSLNIPALMEGVRVSVNKSIEAFTKSEEFREGLQAARDDLIVTKIREVLGQFKDATPAVLKRALDEFVMHEIMEG